MIEKDVAINMLEDIKQCLYDENWKQKILSTTKQYQRGLLVATDTKIKYLLDELEKYDEDSIQYASIKSILNKRMSDIFGGVDQ